MRQRLPPRTPPRCCSPASVATQPRPGRPRWCAGQARRRGGDARAGLLERAARSRDAAELRFQTIVLMPARKALVAIPWPMAPMPRTATGSCVDSIAHRSWPNSRLRCWTPLANTRPVVIINGLAAILFMIGYVLFGVAMIRTVTLRHWSRVLAAVALRTTWRVSRQLSSSRSPRGQYRSWAA
jgi:hypothetical protein